ncbi:MAG: imidazole glycerol phosphate synthase subunit HisH [Candidatus Omnitrophota bacterium]
MVGIIDYGSGNLRSVFNAFRFVGQDVEICDTAEKICRAEKIVLPGVGSSRDAMEGLRQRGLVEPLFDQIRTGKIFLGICLGLQLLYQRSSESGGCDCFGEIKGTVKKFSPDGKFKVPQIGWNTVKFVDQGCPLFKGIKDKSYFYFVHSYYCDTMESGVIAGETDYGVTYTSVLWKKNIFAVQFHPERSQDNGIRILKNFCEL